MRLFFIAGTQLPFKRMDEAIAQLLADPHHSYKITYQSGQKDNIEQEHLTEYRLMAENNFITEIEKTDLIIAHAGVGTLLECIERKKPVLMFPRQAKLNEHRNDHQISTAKKINEIFAIPYYLTVEDLVADIKKGNHTEQGEKHFAQMQRNRKKLRANLQKAVVDLLA